MFAASKTSTATSGYQISRSLRFNSADSAYLNRTFSSNPNRKTMTFSLWVKRSALSGIRNLFTSRGSPTVTRGEISFESDQLTVGDNNGSSWVIDLYSTPVFRDPSAWYHIVVAIDTTQTTSTNRVNVYVNNVIQTMTGTYPSQNLDTDFLISTATSYIGTVDATVRFFDGCMTEVNVIDGQALTPSSFGETNAQTGVWQPKAYSGTYGTNGFYLNFSDNSNTTAATLGKDYSGNGNNWTPNGFSISSGAGNDSMVDVPTPYGIDTGAGGTVRGNYCTFNPLDKVVSSGSVSNGNLDYAATQAQWDMIRSTFGISSGKWYWEVSVNSSTYGITGIAQSSVVLQNNYFNSGACLGYNASNGQKYSGTGGATAYGASWNASGDICGVAFDADAGTLTFYKNGTSQGVAYTGITGTYFPAHTLYDTSTATINFGQRPFAYTAPSGFQALCTQNLPTPTIGATSTTLANKYFDINLWTGNGTSQTLTNSGGFQPDWVWTKGRSNADSNVVVNAVTGANQFLITESTQAEATSSALVSAFTSSGFSIGSSTSINRSSSTYVGWQWKANGAGSSNTSGSITSTVSANTTSGFSIVTYTGNGTTGATVGHGLGVVPAMYITKKRNSTSDWAVYHKGIIGSPTYVLQLQSSDAAISVGVWWNSTNPTSSVFSLGNSSTVNGSGDAYLAYCFAEVEGYSKIGSYTGNGSATGPFIYCGFRPAFVLIKNSTTSGPQWWILDDKRNVYNPEDLALPTSLALAEQTIATCLNFLSNGFQITTTNGDFNTSSSNYVFMAFAENPFKYSLAR